MKRQGISYCTGRRSFFKKAAYLSGTAVLTLLGKRARAGLSSNRPGRPPGQGYRLTPHICKYYEKASL